jgi:four helix bundle protein
MFRFEKMAVWQKSIEFAGRAYAASQAFPREEQFGLTNQVQRAAVSISSNMAEGSGRQSDDAFAYYVSVAYGSLMEVVSQLRFAMHQSFLSREEHDELYQGAEELARMLSGMRSALQRGKRAES